MWAATLPQLESFRLQNHCYCDAEASAEVVVALLRVAKKSGGYERVVLIGHDTGAIVSFVAAHLLHEENDRSTLAGLVAISAPHPVGMDAMLQQIPATSSYILKILSPLFSVFFSAASYDRRYGKMHDLYKDETWRDPMLEMVWERFWRQVGADRIACYHRHNFRLSFPFTLRVCLLLRSIIEWTK